MSQIEQESRAIAGQPCDATANFDKYRILEYVDDGTFMFTLNTATLSTQTHLAPKPAQNTLNHRSEVFQGVVSAVQGYPRSLIFGTNRKCVCDFLLVRRSNLGPILHRFRDIADFCAHDHIRIPP